MTGRVGVPTRHLLGRPAAPAPVCAGAGAVRPRPDVPLGAHVEVTCAVCGRPFQVHVRWSGALTVTVPDHRSREERS